MSATSRNKGAAGEREFCNLIREETGVRLVRNLDQSRDAGHDLIVSPLCAGMVADAFRLWAIEVKRHASAPPSSVRAWWGQATQQAARALLVPALAYREDRGDWRVVVPLSTMVQTMKYRCELEWTAELSLPGFCALVRGGGADMRQEIRYEGRPFSKWHGREMCDIQYWHGYGFVCPSLITTNGDPSLIRQYMSQEDAKKFDAWRDSVLFEEEGEQ